MPDQILTLDTLGELDDGRCGLMIDSALKAMANDLDDRGDDGGERSVTIIIKAKKSKDIGSGKYLTHVTAKTKVPEYKTNAALIQVRRKGDKAIMCLLGDNEKPEKGEKKVPFEKTA